MRLCAPALHALGSNVRPTLLFGVCACMCVCMWVQAFVRACVRACRCYRDGLGVRADKARMFAWFDAAARQGHALAQA